MAYAERRESKLTGRWCADAEYKHANGLTTRMHKAFKSKGEAEGAEAYYRATGEPPPHLISGPANSFEAVARRCIARRPEWLAGNQTRTAQMDFALRHLGHLDIKAVRTAQLEGFVDKVMKSAGRGDAPPAAQTVNNYLSVVGVVLK
jgi:hypothetical protein